MMEILDKRLNDKGKNWRHVFKALTLLEYLLQSGSESVWLYFHDNIYIVKTLKEFQYLDDAHVDQGINVRQKAKEITALLMDETRARARRRARFDEGSHAQRDPDDFSDEAGRRRRAADSDRRAAEDRELEKALAESKRMAEEDERRRRAKAQDDEDLERALAISREDEHKRKENDTLINLDAEDPGPAIQPQYTSFNPYMQYQPTGFNPFFQAQMQQQELLQQQYMQQEYQRQMALQSAAAQYQYLMTQQQQQQLAPQPTSFGSNNPWLAADSAPEPEPPRAPQPEPEPATDTLISLDGPAEPAPTQAPQHKGPPRVKVSNAHPELDRLLASGDGIDTFGNQGDLRMGHNNLWAMSQHRTGKAPNPFAQ